MVTSSKIEAARFVLCWDVLAGCACIPESMFTTELEPSAVRYKRHCAIHSAAESRWVPDYARGRTLNSLVLEWQTKIGLDSPRLWESYLSTFLFYISKSSVSRLESYIFWRSSPQTIRMVEDYYQNNPQIQTRRGLPSNNFDGVFFVT